MLNISHFAKQTLSQHTNLLLVTVTEVTSFIVSIFEKLFQGNWSVRLVNMKKVLVQRQTRYCNFLICSLRISQRQKPKGFT